MNKKEAIEIVRKNYPHVGFSCSEFETALRELVPELAESEDERIRKEIIQFLRDASNSKTRVISSEILAKWAEFLEKQKELSFVKDVMLGYPGHYFYDGERMHFCGNPAMKKRQKEQKPAEWSEEDEEHLDSIIDSYKELLKDYKACHDVDYIPYNSETVIRNVVDDVIFLKSLRPQPHWKPSEEQMDALLASYTKDEGVYDYHALESLYNDLKKLL